MKNSLKKSIKLLEFFFSAEDTSEGREEKQGNYPLRIKNYPRNAEPYMREKIKTWFWIAVSIGISIGIAGLCNN
ncbi:MAG: hypothetical protein SV375_04425 [Thermodesulfobacteriota bacterium]|nr:hypothetical protein [Thermodesulfobacteriota bacterium]